MKNIVLALLPFLLLSCNSSSKQKEVKSVESITPKYAKGFSYEKHPKYTKITVHQPFKGATSPFEYFLIQGDTLIKPQNENQVVVTTPIHKLVATSTTQIPVLEALKSEHLLKGYPNTNFISSKKTRTLIDEGSVIDVGHEEHMNTELVLQLQPDVLFAFAVNNLNKNHRTLKKAGIPIVIDASWLEESPLGRAEWITFFALFLNKEKEAQEFFKNIEKNYLEALELIKQPQEQPKILYGSMFQGIWYAPAGESFIAEILKDAQTKYVWAHSSGTGSLSLQFEEVFLQAQEADFWFSPGMAKTKKGVGESNPHYQQIPPFKNNQLYSYANSVGPTGGLLFFELGALRPDLILKDIIKACHPNTLPDYEATFFKQLE